MFKKILTSIVLSVFTFSCAGLISGSDQDIFIRSSSGDENVKAVVKSQNGEQTIAIPATVKVKRSKAPLTVRVTDKCYKKSNSYASANWNPFLLANIFGSIFGLTSTTVEIGNGNAYTYENNIFVNTNKKSSCR